MTLHREVRNGERRAEIGGVQHVSLDGYFTGAKRDMNSPPKVVFSRTRDKASWNNTTLVRGDIAAELRTVKREPGPGMVILGCGTIVSELAHAGVIDQCQIVVNPVVLGKGRIPFAGITANLPLRLTKTRTFGNGDVVLCYEPMA